MKRCPSTGTSLENPEPDRLIYLQHGFLAAAPWYSHTAAALAEQTNSIVVAPSITSNFLDFGQCWLGGAPMHQAMADLFDDGNTALADSALAAGYDGAIPDRVVLMGHSLGGGAVSGIAGYMTENGTHRSARRRGAARRSRSERSNGQRPEKGRPRYPDLPARSAEVLLEHVRQRHRCADSRRDPTPTSTA